MTAPTGPAAKAPITAPVTNPTGSCGVAGLVSAARAAALMLNNPIVPMVLENTVFITAPRFGSPRGDDRRPVRAIRALH